MTNEELIKEAIHIVNPQVKGDSETGSVGCALLTSKNSIFKGVCIDTISGMGFCAEHSAISQMITNGEYKIKKIVAVWKDDDGNYFILPPCGRCREFMHQINPENLESKVVMDKKKTIKLKKLLPYYDWKQKVEY